MLSLHCCRRITAFLCFSAGVYIKCTADLFTLLIHVSGLIINYLFVLVINIHRNVLQLEVPINFP